MCINIRDNYETSSSFRSYPNRAVARRAPKSVDWGHAPDPVSSGMETCPHILVQDVDLFVTTHAVVYTFHSLQLIVKFIFIK